MRAAASARAPPSAFASAAAPPVGSARQPDAHGRSARSSARSAHQRLMLLMAMGCPIGARLQLVSQGCGQVRPMMAGSGLSPLTIRVARWGCSSRPVEDVPGDVHRRRAGGAAGSRDPAELGGGLAGAAPRRGRRSAPGARSRSATMGGPMVLPIPHQAASSMDSASRRMRATGSSPLTVSALPATSFSISSIRMSTPMRHGPQRPQDSCCSSLR